MRLYLLVALGGALGTAGRMAVTLWMASALGKHFPWGTLAVNVLGSFVIGVLASLPATRPDLFQAEVRMALMVGLCGGFTTFSAFSLQTLELMQKGQWLPALLNVFGSVALCLLGVWLGWLTGSAFTGIR